jgi:hypothetical protein
MIPYILTTLESGESTFGSSFWQFWRNHVVRETLRSGKFLGLKFNFHVLKNSDTFRMAKFPRWSGMKHFNSVSTTEYSDGQAFYDILKVRDQVSGS